MEKFFQSIYLFFSMMLNKEQSREAGWDMPKDWTIETSNIIPEIDMFSSFGLYDPYEKNGQFLKQYQMSGYELLDKIKFFLLYGHTLGKDEVIYFYRYMNLIPEKWKNITILFMGTICVRLDGARFVKILYFNKMLEQWKFSWFCLSENIATNYCVVYLDNLN